MTQNLRVVIGDDHPIFRDAVVRALQADGDIDVVGEARDGDSALELVRTLRPAVAVLDYKMPGTDGIGVAAAIAVEDLPTRILILSAHTDPAVIYRALEQGAAGFLSKESSRADIVAAVRSCAAGVDVIPVDLAASLAGEIRRQTAYSVAPSLAPRELQILTMIADGKSIPAIAGELYLAPSTIKTHVQRLYLKLEVSDRGAAVAEAMRKGIIK